MVRFVRYVYSLEREAMNWLSHYLRLSKKSQSDLARAAGTDRQQINKLVKKDTLDPDWAERLAPHLGVRGRDLIYGPEDGAAPVRLVPVRGETAAGRWVEMDDGADIKYEPVPAVPGRYGYLSQFAFKILGPSMAKAGLPDGGYAICVNYFEARTRITDGDRVVVDRRRGQLVERTCKQIAAKNGGGFELWPRSHDPRYQTPLIVTSRDDMQADDGTEIEIAGLVIGVFVPMDG